MVQVAEKSAGTAHPSGDKRFKLLEVTMKRHQFRSDALIEVINRLTHQSPAEVAPAALAARPAPEHDPAVSAVPAGAVAGLPVLLVEDNPVNREVACEILAQLGCTVETAGDGAQAVEWQRKGAGVSTAELLKNNRVVRAFNCIPAASLRGQANRQPARIAIPIGGDDAAAIAITERLVRDAGFDPVMVGTLAESRQFDLGQPLAQGNLSATELRSRGVNQSRIAAYGVGETQPIASNDTPEGRAQNRRVEIRIVPATQGS